MATPRGERAVAVHAAAHVRSSSPPDPSITYQIDYSTDGGKSWRPVVADWRIPRRGRGAGRLLVAELLLGRRRRSRLADVSSVQVRFRNDGGKRYARCEAQLVYDAGPPDPTRVTFAWTDAAGDHESAHVAANGADSWTLPTRRGVRTRWVEFEPVAGDAEESPR